MLTGLSQLSAEDFPSEQAAVQSSGIPYVSHLSTNVALDRGSRCRMSILRNANVACLCRLFMPMSNVEFKKRLCPMSL